MGVNFGRKIISFEKTGLENCALLGCYVASNGVSLPTFREKLSVPSSRVKKSFLTLEDGNDNLSRNVGKEASKLAEQ
jgi:hypothetical protein